MQQSDADDEDARLTPAAYLQKHEVAFYLRDVTALLLRARDDHPLDFIAEYFSGVLNGTNVLLREYAYLSRCLRDRWASRAVGMATAWRPRPKGSALLLSASHDRSPRPLLRITSHCQSPYSARAACKPLWPWSLLLLDDLERTPPAGDLDRTSTEVEDVPAAWAPATFAFPSRGD